MAVTAHERLADQHRQAQAALRTATIADLLRLWPLFDIDDIAGTWPTLEPLLVALIRSRGRLSARLAGRYYTAASPDRLRPTLAPDPIAEEIVTGLRVVGPINAGRQIAKRRDPREVASATFVNVSGETTRQVLDVGRATLIGSLIVDPRRPRVRRVTDLDPCRWCADQASRTYPPTDRFPAHAHCACMPASVY